MATDGYEHEFRWESSLPQSVVVSGTFDNWSSSLHLERLPSGKFAARTRLPYDTKVLFKYIVDGQWIANSNEPVEYDASGNANNVLHVPGRPSEPLALGAQDGPSEATSQDSTQQDFSHGSGALAAGVGAGAVGLGAGSALNETLAAKGVPEPSTAGDSQGALVPGEAPVDPAPTPAVDSENKTALPTVPSGEHVSDALRIDPTPTVAAPSEPAVLPLVPEPSKVEPKPVHNEDTRPLTKDFVPVVPDVPQSAALGPDAALDRSSEPKASAAALEHQTGSGPEVATSSKDVVAPSTLGQSETANVSGGQPSPGLPAPLGYPSNFLPVNVSDTSAPAAQTAATTSNSNSASTSTAADPTSAAAVIGQPAAGGAALASGVNGIGIGGVTSTSAAQTKPEASQAAPVASSAAGEAKAAPSATSALASGTASSVDKKSETTKTGGPSIVETVKEKIAPGTSSKGPDVPAKDKEVSPSVPAGKSFPSADAATATTPANKTPPASLRDKKEEYSTLGKANAKEVFQTPQKKSAATGAPEPPSTLSTPAKNYITAPTTPATPSQFKADRARKASFFQKVKNAFSPTKKSAA